MGNNKKCSLCGGRLDSSRRCTECGLDNTKNDSMYKHMLNKNDCEDQPLTHVHEAPKTYGSAKKSSYDQTKYATNKQATTRTTTSSKSAKKAGCGGCLGVIVGLIIILSTAVPFVIGFVEEFISSEIGFEDIFEMLPDEQDYESTYENQYWLAQGLYEVGVHIPEGWCEIAFNWDESATIEIYEYDGTEFWIYESYYVDTNGGFYTFHLDKGDFLMLTFDDPSTAVCLYSDSTELDGVYAGFDECHMLSGQMIAGVDFPAGVYDIVYSPTTESGWGYVDLQVMSEEDGYLLWNTGLYFEEPSGDYSYEIDDNCGYYVNIPFTPGTIINVDPDLDGIYIYPSYQIGQEMYDITWGAGQ